MTPAEVKARCDSLAKRLDAAIAEVRELIPHLPLRADEHSAEEVTQQLAWARDICTIIGLHTARQAEDGGAGGDKL
jgi:hypothetical protein